MSVGGEKSGALDDGSVGRRRRRWSEAQKRQIVAETRLHQLLPWHWKAERQQDLAA